MRLLNVTGPRGDTQDFRWELWGHYWWRNLWGPGHAALGLENMLVHLQWWLVGTVFRPREPSSEVWQGLVLEVSSAGHCRVKTWRVCQVAQQSSLLYNEAAPRTIPALALFWSSWSFLESTLRKQLIGPATSPSSPPRTPCLLWWVSVTKAQACKRPWSCGK